MYTIYTKMEGRLILDVIVRKCATIYQCEDESLWVWEGALLVLDLGLDIVDLVLGLDLKSNSLPTIR